MRHALKQKIIDLRNQIKVVTFYKTGLFDDAIDRFKNKIDEELKEYCAEVLEFLSRIKVEESIISSDCNFILKGMQSDYLRYSGKFQEALQMYELALKSNEMEAHNPEKIKLVNSLSVLYFEDLNNTEKAI